MVKIQEKNSGIQKIISVSVWLNEPNKQLYEVLQVADLGTLYEKSIYLNQNIKNIGLVEKSEAQLNIKHNPKSFFFVPIPEIKDAYTKLNVLNDLHYYSGVGLTEAQSMTPGKPTNKIQIDALNKDEIWFVLKVLNEKKLITLGELACITQTGRKYLQEYYFDRDLDPKKIPNKTQNTPQIIKAKAGTVLVNILKWVSKKIDAIIIGIIITVIGGLLLICVIHYIGGRGFYI
jgi:hypothetical protein